MKKLLLTTNLVLFSISLVFASTTITSHSGTATEKWKIKPDVQFSTGPNRGTILMNPEVLEKGTTVYIDEANTYFKIGDNSTKILNSNRNMEPATGWASYFKMYITVVIEYFK